MSLICESRLNESLTGGTLPLHCGLSKISLSMSSQDIYFISSPAASLNSNGQWVKLVGNRLYNSSGLDVYCISNFFKWLNVDIDKMESFLLKSFGEKLKTRKINVSASCLIFTKLHYMERFSFLFMLSRVAPNLLKLKKHVKIKQTRPLLGMNATQQKNLCMWKQMIVV